MLTIKMPKDAVVYQVRYELKRAVQQDHITKLRELDYMLSFAPEHDGVLVDEELFRFLRF